MKKKHALALITRVNMETRTIAPVCLIALMALGASVQAQEADEESKSQPHPQPLEVSTLSPVVVTATASERDLADSSEAHTSELQSLMRISYAVFCLKK